MKNPRRYITTVLTAMGGRIHSFWSLFRRPTFMPFSGVNQVDILAKLGLSAPADVTQAVARTRDAVGHFRFVVSGLFSLIACRCQSFESGTPAPESLSHPYPFDSPAHRAIFVSCGLGVQL